MPVWRGDGSEVESWWWCTDHPVGEWVKIEDDPDAAEAIPKAEAAPDAALREAWMREIKNRIAWRTRSKDEATVHWVTLEEVEALLAPPAEEKP